MYKVEIKVIVTTSYFAATTLFLIKITLTMKVVYY